MRKFGSYSEEIKRTQAIDTSTRVDDAAAETSQNDEA
jgi:hypothetical protein